MSEYDLVPNGRTLNLPMGWRNRCVVVHTSAGKKVLKLYRPGWQLGSVLCEHSILTRLAQSSISATKLTLTREGRTYVTRPDGVYTLFDYVKGDTYSLTFIPRFIQKQLLALSAKALGQIHRELKGFEPQGQHHLGFRSYHDDERKQDIAWYENCLREIAEKSRRLPAGPAKAYADPLVHESNNIIDELHRLSEMLRHASLPRLVIHGDYGFHNLIFHKASRLTVLDFELARLEWRLSDIVLILSRYWGRGKQRNFELVAQIFLSEYEKEYPLCPEERRLFEQVWRFQNLRSAVKYWNSYFATGRRIERLIRARDALARARFGSHVAAQIGCFGAISQRREPACPHNNGRHDLAQSLCAGKESVLKNGAAVRDSDS